MASTTDSRVILDTAGAEHLLGKGDMLLIPPGGGPPGRNHGAFISEVEVNRVVEFLKGQGSPSYDESILQSGVEEGGGGDSDDEDEYDEHYDAAVEIVAKSRQVSISMIQRSSNLGRFFSRKHPFSISPKGTLFITDRICLHLKLGSFLEFLAKSPHVQEASSSVTVT